VGESIAASLYTAAGVIRHHPTAHQLARVGLLARAAFYLVLSYLTVCLVVLPRQNRIPADAFGAMTVVSGSLPGKVGLGLATIGFVAFAVVRLAAAWHDRNTARTDRLTASGQGLTYLLIAAVPGGYLLGQTNAGSELQEHETTQHLLQLPGGQFFVAGVGAVLLVVCAWQIRGVLKRDYSRSFDLSAAPAWVSRCLHSIAAVGIVARAFVFVPIGMLFMVAAVTDEATRATGLNRELAALSGNIWGALVLIVVSAGFVLFAVYSLLECWYKVLHSSL
jgi:hypothetical protein